MKLAEAHTEIGHGSVKALILRDCKKFLKDSKGLPLYRGMAGTIGMIAKKSIRTDRVGGFIFLNPVDELMKQSGFKAHRKNSALCTGNKNVAVGYGAVYQIFPIGDYNFSWSSVVHDYFYDIRENSDSGETIKYQFVYRKMNDEDRQKWIEGWWERRKSSYKTSNMDQAIKSGNEILLAGKEYYAVSIQLSDLLDELKQR